MRHAPASSLRSNWSQAAPSRISGSARSSTRGNCSADYVCWWALSSCKRSKPCGKSDYLCQCFYHAQVWTLIEEGLASNNVVQVCIEIQCLFVLLSDIESNFRIVVQPRLLLRSLHQARTDSLATPIFEHGKGIDIPFIGLGFAGEPASNGGVEPWLISTSKAQYQP